jgi:hypothetical protein
MHIMLIRQQMDGVPCQFSLSPASQALNNECLSSQRGDDTASVAR